MPMRLYGFWRSLSTYRVRVALALKGLEAAQVSIDLLKGYQHGIEYTAVNPQNVVPALIIDDGPPLFQSMAILEYLDEVYPEPPLLPPDPRGRARVRGLAHIVVSDGHPLIVPRIRAYLEKELHVDEEGRNRWLAHWSLKALEAIEGHLAKERTTGRYCHGDSVSIADICLVSQVIGARDYFKCDVSRVPAVMRVYDACMKLPAFDGALPQKQPDAPKNPAH